MSSDSIQEKEYRVSVNTNNPREAIAALASALYSLVEEALADHENHEAEECEFEAFARDVLGVLTRHAEQLSAGEAEWDSREEEEPSYE